jgi:hypothetical protein
MSAVCNRHHAISLLLANDPDLLDFLFTSDRSQLCWETPHDAAFSASMMQREQSLLVRIALDIWNETGFSRLPEVYQELSEHRFEGFLLAMEALGSSRGCHCLSCIHRHHPSLQIFRVFPEV